MQHQSAAGGLASEFETILPKERVFADPLRRLAYGTDASFYRLTPQVVAVAENEAEVLALLEICRRRKAPVTFRAAGTSLSGQAVTDSVLIVLGEGFGGFAYDESNQVARLGPAIVGGEANRRLAPFGRKIGPDPASVATAKIGGIAANNASGMCCGVGQNSYHTLASLRLALADGAVLDTSDPASVAAFRRSHAALLDGLAALSAEIKADETTAARIRDKFRLKNTTGYAINALVDFDDPIDILAHLMIGSEGTLGFLSRVDYRAVPEYRDKASALVVFADLATACRAVSALKSAPVEAVELLDRASLESVKHKKGMPVEVDALGPDAAALLIESRAANADDLRAQLASIAETIDPATTLNGVNFTSDPVESGRLWDIRKGTFPAVGGKRPPGTTVIIEDVAFPVARLAEATTDLRALLDAHGYAEAIIFGHALEGNLHFVFAQGFDSEREVARYASFMAAVAELVVGKYDGSLKAEHGTGRNMAPFVEREWGAAGTAAMRRIKALIDPENLLNPGVLINDDPEIHLKNLKAMPAVSALIDSCIECGFCEPQCPSKGLTLSPRQRITSAREMRRLRCDDPQAPQLTEMAAAYDYAGDATCAGCSLCSTVCPLEIDTGSYIRTLRAEKRGGVARTIAGGLANHFGATLNATRAGLAASGLARRVLGDKPVLAVSDAAHQALGLPRLSPAMPRAAWPAAPKPANGALRPVLFFSSCASRAMGPAAGDDSPPLLDVAARVFARAGFALVQPENLDELCCGQPFASKGFPEIAKAKAEQLAQHLATDGAAIPIVIDASTCATRMAAFSGPHFRPLDLVQFLRDEIAPRLTIKRLPETVAVHVTCSLRKVGLASALIELAEACAEKVIAPPGVTCCGFAGDKGFSHPELNDHALRHLKESLPAECREGYSSNRTCEIGLAAHSGRRYRSILHLVDAASS
ncbi:FAD-binding oxidoreductase [Rhodoblastus acidophilus]|uniref:D-lactate dehydrogenase (cytochrome) n=1 Tax=Candidatus Rhodoblastus alkanivorans TaxID=2954117 RepID=A0ABS9Z6M0_9HYPH|nr:FAD-binding and (Fe-S)-binding domain-containing protein [Candidatus Rhodoblastus alkanivorans]MCI4679871.1 FAD-binding oxidoreductase [Candidatus Rhodoblastus alkanivorans]MCI4682726.1 FAD-binding oxidoreductase [Candidatus Rhodoblastus alkanivorans]MDI4640033.1 FAD-binding oxidoreductase [Rhodoblastus acidophilus]